MKQSQLTEKKSFLLICKECSQPFFTEGEKAFYVEHGLAMPKRCKACRDKRKREKEEQQRREERARIAIEDAKREETLLKILPFRQTSLTEVAIQTPKHTLFVIGNGFDIMHGVSSSYWDFQSTIGKRNELRFHLETYLNCDNLWGNFEENLATLNVGVMLDVIDMWLQDFDAYDPDASMADYYGAIDTAMLPIEVITNTLPERFAQWVRTLTVDQNRKPLECMLHPDAKFINFNYTEFLETVYGIPDAKINYIHGCRKRKHETLILGHAPNTDYLADYEPTSGLIPRYKSKRKMQLLVDAMNIAVDRWVAYYDEMTTKKTPEIIAQNQAFFEGLSDVEDIIVIGHSLANVDYPYFQEIVHRAPAAHWHISWYEPGDLENILRFVPAMGIPETQVEIFCTK